MPKILTNMRQMLLDKTAVILKEEGYSHLSIRRIANECHVATGTVYNYFKSKDEMVAGIMIEDWDKTVDDMKKAVSGFAIEASIHSGDPDHTENSRHSDDPHTDFSNGMVDIAMSIRDFNNRYSVTFGQFEAAGGSPGIVQKYHHLLRDQIDDIMLVLLENTGSEHLKSVIPILSETILTISQRDDIDSKMIQEFAGIIY